MEIDDLIKYLKFCGLSVWDFRKSYFGEDEYEIVFKMYNIEKDGKNVVQIFNDAQWNVLSIHFYSSGLYVKFVVKFEPLGKYEDIAFAYE